MIKVEYKWWYKMLFLPFNRIYKIVANKAIRDGIIIRANN